MKKTIKIMSIVLLAIMLVASFSTVAFASPDDTLEELKKAQQGNVDGTTEITTLGGRIVSIIQVVGVIIAVVIILVIGIKYMIGSAEEKAEYKKTMIPYIVGAVLIFAGSTIVNALYHVITGLQ